jgi:hypothetical protein
MFGLDDRVQTGTTLEHELVTVKDGENLLHNRQVGEVVNQVPKQIHIRNSVSTVKDFLQPRHRVGPVIGKDVDGPNLESFHPLDCPFKPGLFNPNLDRLHKNERNIYTKRDTNFGARYLGFTRLTPKTV